MRKCKKNKKGAKKKKKIQKKNGEANEEECQERRKKDVSVQTNGDVKPAMQTISLVDWWLAAGDAVRASVRREKWGKNKVTNMTNEIFGFCRHLTPSVFFGKIINSVADAFVETGADGTGVRGEREKTMERMPSTSMVR